MDDGGSAPRFSSASGALSSRADYDLGKQVQRKGEVQAVLTEGAGRSGSQRSGTSAARSIRGSRRCSWTGLQEYASGLRISTGRSAGKL